jgi:ferredoxin
MDALDYDLGYAQVNLDRCIGCGLCVTTCPTEALGLERKAEAKQPEVPLNNRELYLKLAKLRGKLGWFKIIKLFTASKFDRWRAA